MSVPELRTTRRMAVLYSALALFALGVAALGSDKLESGLGSSGGAVALLGLWCVLGTAVAIAAIVDAWVKPEGERLGFAVSIAATAFVVVGLLVISGMVAGVADLSPAEEVTTGRGTRSG